MKNDEDFAMVDAELLTRLGVIESTLYDIRRAVEGDRLTKSPGLIVTALEVDARISALERGVRNLRNCVMGGVVGLTVGGILFGVIKVQHIFSLIKF